MVKRIAKLSFVGTHWRKNIRTHFKSTITLGIIAIVLLCLISSCKINRFQEWHRPTKYQVKGRVDTCWNQRLGPFKLHWIKVNDTIVYVQDTTLAKGMPYERYLKRMVR